MTTSTAAGPATGAARTPAITRTRAVPPTARLAAGAVAAPLYAAAVLVQAGVRDGYDITRHPASMLANGAGGWAQIATFGLCGVLMIVAARGAGRGLHGRPGGTWAPRLLTVQGLGLVVAGLFRMDPADGFLGTPLGPPATFSTSAVVHNLAGTVVFVSIIVCCFVLARSFSGAWRWLGRGCGTVFAVGLAWCYSGGELGALALFVGVVIGWGWLSASLARLARTTGRA